MDEIDLTKDEFTEKEIELILDELMRVWFCPSLEEGAQLDCFEDF